MLSLNLENIDIWITLLTDSSSKLIAFANIRIDDSLFIKGIKVFSGMKGIFASFPDKQNPKSKEYESICFFKNAEHRKFILDKVIEKVGEELEKIANNEPGKVQKPVSESTNDKQNEEIPF